MKLKYIYLIIIPLLFLYPACSNKQEKTPVNSGVEAKQWQPTDNALAYWNGFNFSDTATTGGKEFVRWMNLYMHLLKSNPEKAAVSINNALDVAVKESIGYNNLANIFKSYIYDPNSPYRNDEWYILVLEHKIKSGKIDVAELERTKFDLNLLMKNRIGEKAVDFDYTLASGKNGNLYSTHAENILLYFFNPDCESCREATHSLKQSAIINKAVSGGALKILAVYPDKDINLWRSHLEEIPSGCWINSYDQGQHIIDDNRYDLKAIPTLYLLNKDKIVILKDTDVNRIEKLLIEKYPLLVM
ncbi:MAG: DUF5106 domain-containing protein [Prevotella sp.]|jgi:thiol-disulfide isomerase/thioredoxin|nr:DUF5106 domain-containing protein [Prevotella sp.]